ncbi:hypothetical protein [Burkholderia pseudomultivorans]|uniref:Gp38 n=1 Tax=Burkholderia pseudomultivorans TaxID=1207504 RepID=A0A132EGM2_9BURK|nr:hypothetical protein [Burkholderia pseudomultivorans]KWF29879.1 hypothetical protein WT56_15960 [Burkholderia pseudomultivorans]
MNDQQQSRADALTDAAALAMYEKASIAASEFDSVEAAHVAFVRSILAASPVEQPAPTAPCAHDYVRKDLVCTECGEKVASANGTGAEGARETDEGIESALTYLSACGGFDREVDAIRAALSRSPAMAAAAPADERAVSDGAQNFACFLIDHCEGETITEEAIQSWLGKMAQEPRYARAAASPAAEAVAWVRKHPDTGELSGDWLWNEAIEQCRKDSGVWVPLGFLCVPQPAQADAPAAQPTWESTSIANELWQIADVCGYEQFRDAVTTTIAKAYSDGWDDRKNGAASVTYGAQK